MSSPLDIYSQLVEEFNITHEIELDAEFKKTFVISQLEEIKKVLWRESVDYIISTKLSEDSDEIVAQAGQTKKTEKRSNIKQFVKALSAYQELVAELEAQSEPTTDATAK